MVGVGLYAARQDDLLDLSDPDLLTESVATLLSGLLGFSLFLFTQDTLTLCLGLSVDLVEDGLLVAESLGLETGHERLTNGCCLLRFGIDVHPGLCVQLGDEVRAEGEVLGGAQLTEVGELSQSVALEVDQELFGHDS